jgi:hypothetical protein
MRKITLSYLFASLENDDNMKTSEQRKSWKLSKSQNSYLFASSEKDETLKMDETSVLTFLAFTSG